MIIKLDEGALQAAGFPASFIQTMRHLVRQIGTLTNETTLPEVASQTDALAPIVSGLTITLTATNATVADLATQTSEHEYSATQRLMRRCDDLEAALELARVDRTELLRRIEDAAQSAVSLDSNIAELTRRIRQLEDTQP